MIKKTYGVVYLFKISKRWQVISFSRYIFMDEVTYVLQQPGYASHDWIIFKPFSIAIWLPIIGSFIGVAIVFYAANPKAKSVLIRLFGIYINQCKKSTGGLFTS